LRNLEAVGRERSFARAADALLLSQPAVSEQIGAMESILGLKLVHRSRGRKQVELTEAGRILLAACQDVAQTLAKADRALEAVSSLDSGAVTFGSVLSFGGYVLPRVHNAFRRQYPGIAVLHEVERLHAILRGVRERRLDLAVVIGPVDEPGLVVDPLGGYDVVLVAPAGHHLAHGDPVRFAELASESMILPKGTFILRQIIDRMVAEAGITLQVAMEFNNIEAKVQAVVDGIGLAPVSIYGVAGALAAGQVAVLQVEGFPIRLDWFVIHRQGELSPSAQAFRAHLLSYRQELEGASTLAAQQPLTV
jgi:molybdate transport repressor ModE-like protein